MITTLDAATTAGPPAIADAVRSELAGLLASILGLALEAEASAICDRLPYQRCAERQLMRAGSYLRTAPTAFGRVPVRIPRFTPAGQPSGQGDPPAIRANLLTDLHTDGRRLERAVLHLAAGWNAWSAIAELLAPLEAIHGQGGWLLKLRRRILALVEARQAAALPARAPLATATQLTGADGPWAGPRIAAWDVAGTDGRGRLVCFTAIGPPGGTAWPQAMRRLRDRGLLDPQEVAGPAADGFPAAAAACWPRAAIAPGPARPLAI